MSASDEGDDIADVSDETIEVRRGEPVYVPDHLTSSDEEDDGPPTLLVRENECANLFLIQGTL